MKSIVCQVEHKKSEFIYSFHLYEMKRPYNLLPLTSYIVKMEPVSSFSIKVTEANLNKDYFTTLSLDISKKLTYLNFYRAPIYVNLMIPNLFFEDIYLPKMAAKDASKAFELELSKLYPNFNENYAVHSASWIENRKLLHIRVAMCEKVLYTKILFLLRKIGCPIEKVVFYPIAVKDAYYYSFGGIERKAHTKTKILVNIAASESTCILMEEGHVVQFELIPVGTNDLDLKLAQVKQMSREDIRENRKQGLFYQEATPLVRVVFQDIFSSVQRILGKGSKDNLDTIYLNVEEDYHDSLHKVFQKDLRKKVVSMEKANVVGSNFYSDYAATIPSLEGEILFSPKVKL